MADKIISLRLLVDTKEGQAKIENVGEELQDVADKAKAAGGSVKTTSDDMTKGFDVMGEAASQAGISIQGVGTATKLLKGALTGLIAAGILIALNELAKVAKDVYLNMTTAATSARELKEATDQAALSVIGEITELKRLSGVISDTNEAMYVRIDAIEDARTLMPDHLQGLTNEEILYRGITNELNLSIEALLLKAEIEQNQKQIEEKSVKLLETKQKIDDGALANAKKYQFSLLGRITLSTMENAQLSKKERQEKELNALLERRNELQRIAAGGDKKKEDTNDDTNDPNDLDAITKKVVDANKKREEDEKEAERKRKRKRREDEAERKADEAKRKSDLESVDNALAKERSKRLDEIQDDETAELRKAKEKYDKPIAILEQYGVDTAQVVEAQESEVAAIKKKYADKMVADDQKLADEMQAIDDKNAAKKKDADQKEIDDARRVQQAKFDMAADAAYALIDLVDALSKDDEKNAKKSFERNKKLNIAVALIDTFMGAQKAYAQTIGGPVIKGIAAAVATASGLARVAAIKKTKFNDTSASVPDTPGTVDTTQESGFQQTGFTALPQGGERKKPDPIKVYVLESEISKTQTDIKGIKAAVRL